MNDCEWFRISLLRGEFVTLRCLMRCGVSQVSGCLEISTLWLIEVASPAAGKLKSILVSLDDVVAEGQVLAILET